MKLKLERRSEMLWSAWEDAHCTDLEQMAIASQEQTG